MNLSFYGGAGTVTGSKTILELENNKILIDCGMFQGSLILEDKNQKLTSIDFTQLSCILITHAHYDHCGYLPFAIKYGFTGKIYCSEDSKKLISLILMDSFKLQDEDLEEEKRFTEEDVLEVLKHIQVQETGKKVSMADFSFTLFEAGHILGARSILIESGGETIWFSGDIGRTVDLIHKDPTFPNSADFAMIESTYGNRVHSQIDTKKILSEKIAKVKSLEGVLLIPCFAVARTQVILTLLHELMEASERSVLPIYLDSPMGIAATRIYNESKANLKVDLKLFNDALDRVKFLEYPKDMKKLEKKHKPYIVISSSGMMNGGKVLKHFEAIAGNSKNTILLTGFQGENTLGRRLLEGERQIMIKNNAIKVEAEIDVINSLSAHADSEELLSYLGQINGIKKIILNHGEDEAVLALKEDIEQKLNVEVCRAIENTTITL